MDSWTDKQLALMKGGGNDKCNQYLQKHGIAPRTPIKQKYESPHAQLYKLVLKARIEGQPEPTQLPPPVVKKPYQPQGQQQQQAMQASTDAQGMERLAGETDQQYVARQTRLREEAKVRMAAKFGGSGGMGGVGSNSGGSMQGIGSDPSYNPNSGNNNLMSGIESIKSSGASFWGSLSSSVANVAQSMAQPEGGGGDGLADLQRQVASQKPSNSKYSGFGSERAAPSNVSTGSSFGSTASAPSVGGGGAVGEAPGMPTEDRNGMERLSGESEPQYVIRQTRLRDEARARMAAKFGGGGMSGVGSSPAPRPSPSVQTHSAPSSGNAPRLNTTTPPKKMNSNDFFSSFGT
jgi:hypothetical protein